MRINIVPSVIFLCGITLLTACQQRRKVEPSFYYWKTTYRGDSTEQQYLKETHAKRLFVRIMDIDNQGANGEAIPVSPIMFKEPLPDSVALVPVVFIVNNVLKNQSNPQLDDLAQKIYHYVERKVKQSGKLYFSELQIDCDWTDGTKEAYFYLLECLRERMDEAVMLSSTLRLHQVRNLRSSGVPPVDRVLLMCYNMGNLRKYGSHNSILDMQEMELYLSEYLANYPLPLDVALPLFNWSVVFRDEQYAGISKKLDAASLNDSTLFSPLQEPMLYRLEKPMPQAGLRVGDVIRREETRIADLTIAADFLSRYLPNNNFTLVFYHLDAGTLTPFSHEALQEIITCF
ncbi:hypothetical protein [Parapedobacter tibetensis]|uniref:hypothetical protein n=1 Tax=Parapedobacter tibetensis TaxID=2972951 RepID=UPI00214D8581|nr:hypothetical protein [Parapedobacter tibetensis]